MTSTYNRTMNESFEESVADVKSIRTAVDAYELALRHNGAYLVRSKMFRDIFNENIKSPLSIRNQLTDNDKLALGKYCKNFIRTKKDNCLKNGYIIEREGLFSFIFKIKRNGKMISRILSINEEAVTEDEFKLKASLSDDGLSCDIFYCHSLGFAYSITELLMYYGKEDTFIDEEVRLLDGLKKAVEYLDAKLRMLRKKDESQFQMKPKNGFSFAENLTFLHDKYAEDSASEDKIWGILSKEDYIDTEKNYTLDIESNILQAYEDSICFDDFCDTVLSKTC